MAAKSTKGLSWSEISEAVGLSEIFLASACLGQNSLLAEDASKLTEYLELDEEVAKIHLKHLDADLTKLTKSQARYIGVKVEGPFKKDEYRYWLSRTNS